MVGEMLIGYDCFGTSLKSQGFWAVRLCKTFVSQKDDNLKQNTGRLRGSNV